MKRLGDYIRQLAPQRITETVGHNLYKHLDKDPTRLLDLPTWNEYIGTWHGSGKKIREELPGYFDLTSAASTVEHAGVTNKKACGYVSTDVPSQNRVGGTPYIARKHRLK